jgi:PAS domain S-box-containing protein
MERSYAAPREPVITFLIDCAGILLSVEKCKENLDGIPDLRQGVSVLELYDNQPDIRCAIQKALKGEVSSVYAHSMNTEFSSAFHPVVDSQGHVTHVFGICFKNGQDQKSEALLRKNEFRWKTLFDSANDAIFTMDNKTFIDCNEATLRIFQCKREDIIGQTPYRFSPGVQPDGRSSEESALEKIHNALSGKAQFFEWRHIRLDGTPFDAEVSLNRLDLGDQVYIQAMVRDVSQRKRTEEENKKLALVANTTTNMVVIADGAGRVQWVNPAFTRTTGFTLEEVIGKTPGSLLRGPQTDPVMSKLMGEKVRSGQGFKDLEILNYTKDRRPYWVSIEVTPIFDDTGKAIQFIGIESDVTERKSTQQALLDRNEELIKINSELDRFVYSASHDLRAPISSLLGLIEVARLEKNPETIGQLLEMQKKSLLRMDRFIRDIVDHSRNTRLSVECENINFERMVHATFEQLQFMENVNQIRKVISIRQDGPFYTSSTRIDILLNNLISNAIKYADLRKEDPFLEVTVVSSEKQTLLTVRDNGEGIPSEAQPKIFDMFYRASGRGSGSGLGLYIVKEAIHKLEGEIQVASEYGKGTQFTVKLPNLKK